MKSADPHRQFFYEYSRESDRVRSLVRQASRWRKLTDQLRRRKFKPADLDRNRRTSQKTTLPRDIFTHHLSAVIFWLAGIEQFPATPWENLPESARNTPLLLGKWERTPALQIIPSPWAESEELSAAPHETLLRLRWLATDSELIQEFKQVLERERPAAFQAHTKASAVQLSFDGTRLPFRKSAALDWLDVLRKREKVKTWSEYFKHYLKRELKRDGAQRPYLAHCRKAKLILEWFKNGTALQKTDFR